MRTEGKQMDKYINTGELCEKVESVGISFVEIDTRNKILESLLLHKGFLSPKSKR